MRLCDEFREFCENSGFYIDDNQDLVIDQIFDNIEKECLIQIVIMPNAAGKTNLSLLLSCFLTKKGKEILRYSPMELPTDYRYLPHVKHNSEWMEKVQHANAGTTIHQFKIGLPCDFVIADGLAYTDISKVKNNIVANKIEEILTNSIDRINTLSQVDLEWLGQLYLAKLVANAKAKTIIFMKQDELELCSKSTFLLSGKKTIIDIYQKNKKDIIDSKVNNCVNHPSAQDIVQELKKYFDNRMDRVEYKIDDINNKVNEMHSIMNALNLKVSKQKEVISYYAEISDDEESIEKILEDVLNRLVKQLNEEIVQYERLNSFQQYRQLVMVRMGQEAWNKLDDNSQRFLVTSKFTFAENILLGDNIDYSSICLLASKAFEIELAKRFVTEYEKYLHSKFGISYDRWPSSVIKVDKNGKLRPMTEEEFMLGSCPYIMGILSKDRRMAKMNKDCFRDYCKSVLIKKNDLGNLDDLLAIFDKQIKTIKNKYRNPAAHKESIGMLEASECIDYILEVERVLKMMLESFNY